MYLVVAGNQTIFERWCIQKGISRRDARRVINLDSIRGKLNPDVKVIYTCQYSEVQDFEEINDTLMAHRILPLYESCCDRQVG